MGLRKVRVRIELVSRILHPGLVMERIQHMIRHSCRLMALAFTGMLPLLAPAQVVGQNKAVEIDTLISQWTAKQDSTSKLKIEWEEYVTRPKGYLSQSGLRRVLGIEDESDVPPEDSTLLEKGRLIYDGERMRLDREVWQWSNDLGRYVATPHSSSFDGVEFRRVWTNGSTQTDYPDGSIQALSKHQDATSFVLFPIRAVFRANDENYWSVNPHLLHLTGKSAVIRGRKCLELRTRVLAGQNSDERSVEYWVDPDREFVVMRYRKSSGNKIVRKVDIDYFHQPGLGWVPESWTMHASLDGISLYESRKGNLLHVSIPEQLSNDDFKISFPAGCVVTDSIRDEYYVVREDHTKREIARDEYGAPYEQLLATDNRNSFFRNWIVWIGFFVFLALIGILSLIVIRRFRVKNKP